MNNYWHIRLSALLAVTVFFLSACVAPQALTPAGGATNTPVPGPAIVTPAVTAVPKATAVPGPQGSPLVLVQAADQKIYAYDLRGHGSAWLAGDHAYTPFGQIGSTIYAYQLNTADYSQSGVLLDASGVRPLSLPAQPFYHLIVAPGAAGQAPRLTWSVITNTAGQAQTELYSSAVDGSGLERLLAKNIEALPLDFAPLQWSADGQRLYYGEEPNGIGGYILYSGVIGLSAYDRASGKTAVLIAPQQGDVTVSTLCVQGVSPDEQFAATLCKERTVSVVNLSSGQTSEIVAGPDVPAYKQSGDVLFAPSSSRLAFAAARGEADNEQSWLLASDGLSGAARIVATGEPGRVLHLRAWLDENTLLFQSGDGATGSLWSVHADGSGLQRIADGAFIGILR